MLKINSVLFIRFSFSQHQHYPSPKMREANNAAQYACPVCLLLILHLTVFGAVVLGQSLPYPQWGELPPGPYKVGFQVFNRYDRGRSVQPKADFEGNLNPGEKALPIQISVWSPSEVAAQTPPMLFEEYQHLTQQKNTFQPLTDEDRKRAAEGIQFIAKFGAGIDLSEAELQTIRHTPTAAHRDAKPAAGKFPVIISGLDGGPSSANILYEYLASQGYVVFSTPTIGRSGTLQVTHPQIALNERIGNLEFLLNFSHTFANADPTRLGVLGINFDGMAALLFEMKNRQADAVVSLDGWEGKSGSSNTLKQSVYFDVNKMRVPYLTVLQDEKDPRLSLQLSREIFDEFLYADRYYYVLKEMNHSYLIGNLGVLPSLPPEKRQAYQFLYTTLFHFFEASLKKSPSDLDFLKKSARENGFSADLAKTELKKAAFPPVPTTEEVEKLIMAGNIEKVAAIFQEAKRFNPKVLLFDEQTMNLYAFRFTQQKQPDKVLAVRRLPAEAFPQSVYALENLGNAYQAMEQKQKALECFEKALALIDKTDQPDNPEKERMRKMLQEKIKMKNN
ncbi:MAG: tetratricopeptide repeat protein [Spirosomataceae bacterium]